jgi:hypothetical protein
MVKLTMVVPSSGGTSLPWSCLVSCFACATDAPCIVWLMRGHAVSGQGSLPIATASAPARPFGVRLRTPTAAELGRTGTHGKATKAPANQQRGWSESHRQVWLPPTFPRQSAAVQLLAGTWYLRLCAFSSVTGLNRNICLAAPSATFLSKPFASSILFATTLPPPS